MPFAMEGNMRYKNAVAGLEKLESIVDTLIVILNHKLIDLAPDLPIQTAFKVADEILTNAVKGIAELVTKPGLVNLDCADVRTIMCNGGVALIGVGESDAENRASEAVEKALNNPLLDADISGASGALINVAGGPDMTLDEVNKIGELVTESLDPDANVIWGARVSDTMKGKLAVMTIITGVNSPWILGKADKKSRVLEARKISDELGIDYFTE